MTFWNDKVALVTGGSAGLGLAIAGAFLRAGSRVAIVGRDAARLETAVQNLHTQCHPRAASSHSSQQILAISADVTQQADVDRMVAECVAAFGRLDVLVNNAGQSMRGEVLRTPVEEFARLIDLNFLSVVRCTQAAAEHLIASGGHIVNIGSLASKGASRYLGAYPASKFPVAAFSQQLRLELGPKGVHTLLVCPGPIRREEESPRYADQAADLPPEAMRPGGGVKLKGVDPQRLADMILRACQRRQAELVVPGRARLLFAIAQLWPALGDWIVRKSTGS